MLTVASDAVGKELGAFVGLGGLAVNVLVRLNDFAVFVLPVLGLVGQCIEAAWACGTHLSLSLFVSCIGSFCA